jgi:hypothetical protein
LPRRSGSTAGQFNPDEVTVQDMKKALDNPSLGLQVIAGREADEYEITNVDGVSLLLSKPEQRVLQRSRSQPAILSVLQSRWRVNKLRQKSQRCHLGGYGL